MRRRSPGQRSGRGGHEGGSEAIRGSHSMAYWRRLMIPDANTETNGSVERIETREANSGYFKSNFTKVDIRKNFVCNHMPS